LEKDKEVLFAFTTFRREHWPHLRTTNPIESLLEKLQAPLEVLLARCSLFY